MKQTLTVQYPSETTPLVGDEFEQLIGDVEVKVRVVKTQQVTRATYEVTLEYEDSVE
jgi:hypothetical protein